MSKIQEIKDASLAARKSRLALRSTLLITLYAEASMIGKNAGRETTDEETIKVIKKFMNNLEETKKHLQASPADTSIEQRSVDDEIAILNEFLPRQLTDDQIKDEINLIIMLKNYPLEPKSMGLIMKELNVKLPGLFDGAKASQIIREILKS